MTDRTNENTATSLHEILIQRDHIIGLEAALASAERENKVLKARQDHELGVLRVHVSNLELMVESLEIQLNDLRQSEALRVGRLITAPIRLIKRATR